MRPATTRVGSALLAILLGACGDEGSQPCPPGQQLAAEGCVNGCGQGTTFDATSGLCLPAADTCADDEVWLNGACTNELACGPGTVLLDGTCVVDDNLCPEGRAWAGSACVDVLLCGAGTVAIDGSCTPVDPLADAHVVEAAEPNDGFFAGTPTAFELAGTVGQPRLLGGVIGPATDVDGDAFTLEPDLDGWTFAGRAGQRLRVEATALGLPTVAFAVTPEGASVPSLFAADVRFGLPLSGHRNAAREVVLPRDGRYRILVGDRAAIYELTMRAEVERRLDAESADALALLGLATLARQWVGSENDTYLVAVTELVPLVPTPLPEPVDGMDLVRLPSFTVSGQATRRVMAVRFAPERPEVLGVYRLSTPGTGAPFFEGPLPPVSGLFTAEERLMLGGVEGGSLHWLEPGGLVLQTDFLFSTAPASGFGLEVELVPALDIAPGGTAGETVDLAPGSAVRYAMTFDQPVVLRVAVEASDGRARPAIGVLDGELRPIVLGAIPHGYAFCGFDSRCELELRLEAGPHVLVVSDHGVPDALAPVEIDLHVEAWPIAPLDELALGAEHLESDAALSGMGAVEQAFFGLEIGEIGDFTFEVTPDSDIGLAVDLYQGALLTFNGLPATVVSGASSQLGEPVALSFSAAPVPVTIRVAPVEMGEGSDGNAAVAASLVSWGVTLDAEPGHLGVIGLGTRAAIGELRSDCAWRCSDSPSFFRIAHDQAWSFEVASPARVEISAVPLGTSQEPWDFPSLHFTDWPQQLRHDFDRGIPAVFGVHAGHYDRLVATGNGFYLLEARALSLYDACLPDRVVCDPAHEVLATCHVSGDGLVDDGVVCTGGCGPAWPERGEELTPITRAGFSCRALEEHEPFGYGQNDSWDAGLPLAPGGVIGMGRTDVLGRLLETGALDVDWYRFSLAEPRFLELKVRVEHSDPIGVRLFDANGREVGEPGAAFTGTWGTRQFELEAGDYGAAVVGRITSRTSVPYRLIATLSDSAPPPLPTLTETSARFLQAHIDLAAQACICPEDFGVSTEEDCIARSSPHPGLLECEWEPDAGLRDYLLCRAELLESVSQCLEDAATCDDRSACRAPADPSNDPCLGGLALERYERDLIACAAGPPGSCPDTESPTSALGPAVFTGSTFGAGDDYAPADTDCAHSASGAPDLSFEWEAPATGTFVFDTSGSAIPAVLSLRESCEGGELACAVHVTTEPFVRVELLEGQRILVGVEGVSHTFPPAVGDVVVNIAEEVRVGLTDLHARWLAARIAGVQETCSCHFADYGFTSVDQCVGFTVDIPADSSTCFLMGPDSLAAELACEAELMERFAVCLAEAACDPDAELACDDLNYQDPYPCESPFPEDRYALAAELEACVAGDPGSCPDSDEPSSAVGEAVFTGSTFGAGADLALGCATASSPDLAFEWVAPSSGTFAFDTRGTSFFALLGLVDGCGGAELACGLGSADGYHTEIEWTFEQGQSAIVVVTGWGATSAGDVVVNVSER